MQESSKTQANNDSDFNFDVDELVKKIDAKIAELEEEEKKNKGKEEQKITPIPEVSVPKTPVSAQESVQTPIPEVTELKPTPVVENKPVNNLELSDDDSDDDFFDDFFDN